MYIDLIVNAAVLGVAVYFVRKQAQQVTSAIESTTTSVTKPVTAAIEALTISVSRPTTREVNVGQVTNAEPAPTVPNQAPVCRKCSVCNLVVHSYNLVDGAAVCTNHRSK